MAGSKRPIYYETDVESDFYEKTPKHVLYAIARDYALQVLTGGEARYADLRTMQADMLRRTETLKLNGLIA